MSWTGCKSVRVIRSDEVLTFVPAGKAFTPSVDGVYMSDSLYRRYRRAVADKVLESSPTAPND